MKRVMVIAAIAALVLLALSVQAAEDDAKARDQFQQILDGFNSREFEMIEPTIECVVEIGSPNRVATSSNEPADASAPNMP